MAEARRVAFLGIGHRLRRDDAAGVEVCERMRPALDGRRDVLVVSGGSAPENCVGVLRAFAPDLVVVIDAARMGQPPGTILRIAPSDPRAAGASTHTLPLPAFCEYVQSTLGCEVTLLGIEPADTSFGEGLTPAVEQAVEQAAREAVAQLAYGPVNRRPPSRPSAARALDGSERCPLASPPAPRGAARRASPRRAFDQCQSHGGEGVVSSEGRGERSSPLPLKNSLPSPSEARPQAGHGFRRGRGKGRGPEGSCLGGGALAVAEAIGAPRVGVKSVTRSENDDNADPR